MTTIDATTVRLADADQHYYEPVDAITARLDRQYASAFRWVVGSDGRTRLLLGASPAISGSSPRRC